MTICLSVSGGGICRSRNDIFSLLFLFFLISGGRKSGVFSFSARRQSTKKSLMPRESAAQGGLLTMILFLFFLPVISGPDAQRECHFEDQREWEGTAGSLFILYDRPLVDTICSGFHYIPTTISIQII